MLTKKIVFKKGYSRASPCVLHYSSRCQEATRPNVNSYSARSQTTVKDVA